MNTETSNDFSDSDASAAEALQGAASTRPAPDHGPGSRVEFQVNPLGGYYIEAEV